MANTINANYFMQYQNAAQFGKQNATAAADKNPLANYGTTTVEISDEGLDALKNSAPANAEDKLSDKAKGFLESLRQKYGDYDFFVADNPDAAQTLGSTKEYSVIFTPEELERMADDDDYAQKVMGKVGDAVDMLKDLSEKDLGEGVKFSSLSVAFDEEGNMKLFAQLEKLTDEQNERLEAAKARRDEERKEESEAEEPELTKILFKGADVEADSAEGLLAKIFGIDWENIAEEEAYI